MSRYTVTYERDESGWWVAQVREVSAAITQGRTVAQARTRIREALALVIGDKEAEAAKLVDDVRLPARVKRSLARVAAARRKAAAAQAASVQATGEAVRILAKDLGLSVRDVGELVGLSHQRVHQLAHGR
jgi:predicted RNase H-like HicB family nuclease